MNRPEFCSTGCPQWMVCACAFRGAECPFAKVDRAIKNYNNNQRGIEGMKLIRTSYEIITYESAEDGDHEEKIPLSVVFRTIFSKKIPDGSVMCGLVLRA